MCIRQSSIRRCDGFASFAWALKRHRKVASGIVSAGYSTVAPGAHMTSAEVTQGQRRRGSPVQHRTRARFRLPRHGETTTAEMSNAAAESVEQIVRLENRDRVEMSASDRLADLMTAFSGSMLFVWLHGAWFVIWIVLNEGPISATHFDVFPFGLLTMIVS